MSSVTTTSGFTNVSIDTMGNDRIANIELLLEDLSVQAGNAFGQGPLSDRIMIRSARSASGGVSMNLDQLRQAMGFGSQLEGPGSASTPSFPGSSTPQQSSGGTQSSPSISDASIRTPNQHEYTSGPLPVSFAAVTLADSTPRGLSAIDTTPRTIPRDPRLWTLPEDIPAEVPEMMCFRGCSESATFSNEDDFKTHFMSAHWQHRLGGRLQSPLNCTCCQTSFTTVDPPEERHAIDQLLEHVYQRFRGKNKQPDLHSDLKLARIGGIPSSWTSENQTPRPVFNLIPRMRSNGNYTTGP